MIYSCAELRLLPWAHQHLTSMTMSTFVSKLPSLYHCWTNIQGWLIPKRSRLKSLSCQRHILFRKTQSRRHCVATALSFVCIPRPLDTITAHKITLSAIDRHPTAPTKASSIAANSYSILALPCAQTAEWYYSSMACASMELILLPPWAYWNPVSMTLLTIISPKAIAGFQHKTTRIKTTFCWMNSTNKLVGSSSPKPILDHAHCQVIAFSP